MTNDKLCYKLNKKNRYEDKNKEKQLIKCLVSVSVLIFIKIIM